MFRRGNWRDRRAAPTSYDPDGPLRIAAITESDEWTYSRDGRMRGARDGGKEQSWILVYDLYIRVMVLNKFMVAPNRAM